MSLELWQEINTVPYNMHKLIWLYQQSLLWWDYRTFQFDINSQDVYVVFSDNTTSMNSVIWAWNLNDLWQKIVNDFYYNSFVPASWNTTQISYTVSWSFIYFTVTWPVDSNLQFTIRNNSTWVWADWVSDPESDSLEWRKPSIFFIDWDDKIEAIDMTEKAFDCDKDEMIFINRSAEYVNWDVFWWSNPEWIQWSNIPSWTNYFRRVSFDSLDTDGLWLVSTTPVTLQFSSFNQLIAELNNQLSTYWSSFRLKWWATWDRIFVTQLDGTILVWDTDPYIALNQLNAMSIIIEEAVNWVWFLVKWSGPKWYIVSNVQISDISMHYWSAPCPNSLRYGPGVYDQVNFPPYSWNWFDDTVDYIIPTTIWAYFLLPDPALRDGKLVWFHNNSTTWWVISCQWRTATDPNTSYPLAQISDQISLSAGESAIWISNGVTWMLYATHINMNPFTVLNSAPIASWTFNMWHEISRLTITTSTASWSSIRLPLIFFIWGSEFPFFSPGRIVTIVNSTISNTYNILNTSTNLGVPIVLAPRETAVFVLTRVWGTPWNWAYIWWSVLKPNRVVYRIVTATSVLTQNDDHIVVSNWATNITITLLNPLLYPGKVIAFTRDATSTWTITVQSAWTWATVQALLWTLWATTTITAHWATWQWLGIKFIAIWNSRYRF